MSPRFEAVLFDLDDTLLASNDALTKALAAVERLCCRETGASAEAYRSASRSVTARLFEAVESGRLPWARARLGLHAEALEALGQPNPDLATEMELLFGQTQLRELRMFEDAVGVLDQLRGRLPMGLVTNGAADRHPESQRSKVDFFGLDRYLSTIAISDEIGARKPHPEIFQAALGKLELRPDQVLFVGDNLKADIAGANRAGLVSVWLDRHAKAPATFPEGAAPAHTIHSLSELPHLLGL